MDKSQGQSSGQHAVIDCPEVRHKHEGPGMCDLNGKVCWREVGDTVECDTYNDYLKEVESENQ